MAANNNNNKSNLPLLIGAIAVLCLAIVVVAIPKSGKEDTAAANADTEVSAASQNDRIAEDTSDADESGTVEEAEVQVIEAGGSLVIPISEISTTAQFYPIEVDGMRMEVLAVEDSDGNVRTAFNTCQICYASGRGYYVQEGDVLVCQNCGNRFTIDQVEIETGGCNPWPIFSENKTVTEDTIEISYDYLQSAKEIFANWKAAY